MRHATDLYPTLEVKMVDYSKWDNIEVSDDEDETHPNIDTPSLFRWRHQARVDRMEEAKKEKEAVESQSLQSKVKLEQTRKQLEALKTSGEAEKISKVKEELQDLEEQNRKWREKEEELAKKEKLTPWNVDTLSHDGFSSTRINKYTPRDEDLTEEEQDKRQARFVKKNEKDIKKYGMHRKWDDTGEFLQQHTDLVCEYTANYLVIWAIDLMVEKKESLMEQVAHQTIVMQFILELAKSLKQDPRACVRPFFQKIKSADKKYMESFHEELDLFKGRIRKKAQERIERAEKEAEEEMERERQARLGPGGLDPVEVFESLPAEMQACFESKDISMLQKVVGTMEPADAEYHIKRCVDSGLWVPGGGEKDEGGAEDGAKGGVAGENIVLDDTANGEEPTYESVSN
ncbi:hsp90 co-chaperone Cdc37-like [Patiria miniata]|uniref:Hsp90 chaperone protein kinase-targeting subunit n=1 Tax=Patiria miniata TaxID=46514 RepID=A0A913ZB45_PATMI|nr:hsp90 co-chaperone Cdc37-like [Patiria miniata]